MKVAENRKDSFKENKTFYVRNEINISRRDNWQNDMKAKGFLRSDSYPKFFKTASKNNYVRERSSVGRKGSNIRRNTSQSNIKGSNMKRNTCQSNRVGSSSRLGMNNMRTRSKSRLI